jgi:small subunit ribosomal protein S6
MGSMLREYETIFVLHPDLTDDIATQIVDRLKEVISRMGGELLATDQWGKRKLAFSVKKQQRGNYVLFHYIGPVGIVEELERTLRNLDQVIRFLTNAFGTVQDVEAKRAEVEKKARERAQERARQEAERREREERMAREAEEGGEESEEDRPRDRDRDRGERGERDDRRGERDRGEERRS